MNDDIRKLATIAGLILSGKTVEFRFTGDMPLDGVRGLAFRNKAGPSEAVVLVDKYLDDAQLCKTILHEISHVKFDFGVMMDVTDTNRLIGRYTTEVRKLPEKRESKARHQAELWVSKAEQLAPGGTCAEKLSALGVYYLEITRRAKL